MLVLRFIAFLMRMVRPKTSDKNYSVNYALDKTDHVSRLIFILTSKIAGASK